MKKYILLLLFFLLSILLINSKQTYAFADCSNKEIYPKEVSTINLKEYLNTISYKELTTICSFNRCYTVKESNIDETLDNFNKRFKSTLNEEEEYIIYVKGYPISKIVLNNCK